MIQKPYILLTASRFLDPAPDNAYITQVHLEDRLLIEAFESLGHTAIRKAWDDKDYDWSEAEAVVFRATWDYFERFEEFMSTIQRMKEQTKLINPQRILEWTLDKHYLRDLNQKGIRIPPTYFIPAGSNQSLQEWVKQSGWKECILKPVMGATARHTFRFLAEDAEKLEDAYQNLIQHEAFMLQEFMETVLTEGEISLVVLGGQVTHAVLKRAKPGDFRVQDDFGGTVHPHTPNQAAIDIAEAAIRACPATGYYARVDLLLDSQGQYCLSELEMIEPELFFRFQDNSAGILAKAIVNSQESSRV